MSISNIRQPHYTMFWKHTGRVVAIHPLALHSEAEKWQKGAYEKTIWSKNGARIMRVYERERFMRLWYLSRVCSIHNRALTRADV